MGLIRAALGAAGGVVGDQWKEYFYCEALDNDVLVVKGSKRVSGRSSNRGGTDNIISNGSVVAVADGQCMIIVEQGKIAELCAEPGEFVYDSSTEPSIFSGSLGTSIEEVFKNIGKRFTFGGEPPKDQRVCGNVSSEYTRDNIDGQLKTELLTALQPAFAKISDMGIRYSSLPGHTMEIAQALNEVLSPKWCDLRGIEVVSFGVSSVKASEEDEAMLKEMQRTAAYRDPGLAAANLSAAQAQAMRDAAKNSGGAAVGFMGMNMASQMGGMNAQNLYQMAGQYQQPAQQQAAPAASAAGTWKCPKCGASASGKFCPECGAKKPEDGKWTCSCGAVNTGKFCSECGAKKPGTIKYKCDKCGWEPKDPTKPPKFCPECGDPFDTDDVVG